ncbi:TPA: hypothetical protein MW242_003042 [Acinetobacter baumannii]|nr:hypothetical protein [Acinetobacter baumannii]
MVLKKRIFLALLISLPTLALNAQAKNTTVDIKRTPVVSTTPLPLIKANAIEQYYVNVKHRFNGASFEQPPRKIKNIRLSNNIIENGEVIVAAKEKDRSILDTYLAENPKNSELLASYVARMVNYNKGYTVPEVKGEHSKYASTTVYDAMLDELNYRFAQTPVNSVINYQSQQDIDAAYLYILSRLDDQEKSVFWQFINTYKTGNSIEVPEGTTIADVLNTYKIQLSFPAQ